MGAPLLHHLLEASARRSPDQVAVIARRDSITYRELDALSSRVAGALRAGGVERGDRVGVHMAKSIEAVVAIFGALKAGAAYVPIDPQAPPRRVAHITADCGLAALVAAPRTLAELLPRMPEPSPLRCVLAVGDDALDTGACTARLVSWREVTRAPAREATADLGMDEDLAYILYTSGSTGVPKGVMISHGAARTFVSWARETFALAATDRVAGHAPLHFDLSILDIFATVGAGGTVVLVPESVSVFPRSLADFLEEHRITVSYTVPSTLTRLVVHGDLGRHAFGGLRHVLFAGEVFPIRHLRQLMRLVPRPAYWNLYGPTETNVCTSYRVADIPPDQTDPCPIGRACSYSSVIAVVDGERPAAPGEIGELFVGGSSLMSGYWGMPERTAAALGPVPGTADPPRAYRTGDLVRRARDGNYLFVGRADEMIKSRGYRIELGEIEAALYAHAGVEEAAVVAIPDDEVTNVVQALVVARPTATLTAGALAAHCAERLPRYMVPSRFVLRPSLPRTSTGKIDKRRLVQEEGGARPA